MGKWILGVLGTIISGVVVYWLTQGVHQERSYETHIPAPPIDTSANGANATDRDKLLRQQKNLPPREQYARAFAQLEKRQYEAAATSFAEFLKANPDDPLADRARYWLGETYYARGEYPRSAEVFLNAYEKSKTGPMAPDTLLKLGLSLAGMNKNKEACASFHELNRAFPNALDAIKERADQEAKRIGCP